MPSLLSSAPEVTSSTSDSISLMVDVNEQANCEGVEGLTITVSVILTNYSITLTRQSDFADVTIVFPNVPAGDHTCSVTVEDGTGPIESMQISCGTGEM